MSYLFYCFIACFISLSALANDYTLPNLGNSARSLLSHQQERHLGRSLLRNLRSQQQLIDDPLLVDYIQQLGQRLSKPQSSQPYRFFILDQPSINAFAGPAGYIGIHTGLIQASQTESELASVLAHEIAHVEQQHLLQVWESAASLSLPKTALALATIAIGAASGNQAGIALAAGSQAALLQQQINYTRRHEQEADRIGIQILAQAGYNPHAMATFFTRISQKKQLHNTLLPELLLSHPVNNQRTAEALDRAADYPYTQHLPDPLGYHLAKVRLQRHQAQQPISPTELQQRLDSGRYANRLAAEYALVLALHDNNQGSAAAPFRQHLLRQRPDQAAFIIAQAEYEVQQNRVPGALQRLQSAIKRHPTNLALAITHAEMALAHDQAQTALSVLQNQLHQLPQRSRLYHLLARAAGQLQKHVLTHQYLAEYHAIQGDYAAAIQQIQQALQQPNLSIGQQTGLETRQQQYQTAQADSST